jgi:hypothetical protein
LRLLDEGEPQAAVARLFVDQSTISRLATRGYPLAPATYGRAAQWLQLRLEKFIQPSGYLLSALP